MAIENINDLETAEIRTDDNGKIDDLYIAIYKDEELNFTSLENFPVYSKYKIDKKIKDFEKDMTLKMQECNIINKIYVKDDSGELVESYLTLEQIADKMNSLAYDEIGVRYNISTVTGKHTNAYGNRCIRKGLNTLIDTADIEPANLRLIYDKLEIRSTGETKTINEDIFARDYFPWNKMRQVQISLDGLRYNYDMLHFSNGGNYFTEVPLYYVDQRYIIEEAYQVSVDENTTAYRYRPIKDITGIWDPVNPLNSIPTEYQNDSYSIGMYKWVCEYPLYGYRPASFFINKVNKIPEIDDGKYSGDIKRYVKVEINKEIYFILYKNYLEGNLKTGEVPELYCLELEDYNGYNTNILTSKHYFACYEMSNMQRNEKLCGVSMSSVSPLTHITISEARELLNNLGPDYYIQDMRSRTDFYGHLMDIEFGTLDSTEMLLGQVHCESHTEATETGSTKIFINSRNGAIFDYTINDYPSTLFRWNWIENVYGNVYKYIDGCYIKNGKIYYCDVPKLYGDISKYKQLDSYELITTNVDNDHDTDGYVECGELGFDILIPWLQLPTKSYGTTYHDFFKNVMDANDTETCGPIIAGGSFNSVYVYTGLRHFVIAKDMNHSDNETGVLFEKMGE